MASNTGEGFSQRWPLVGGSLRFADGKAGANANEPRFASGGVARQTLTRRVAGGSEG